MSERTCIYTLQYYAHSDEVAAMTPECCDATPEPFDAMDEPYCRYCGGKIEVEDHPNRGERA